MDRESDGSDERPSGRWWVPIAIQLLIFIVLIVLGNIFISSADGGTSSDLLFYTLAALSVVGFLAFWVAVVSLYYDRKYVSAVSEWNPSGLYFLMFLLPLGLGQIVTILYLYKRHVHVGIP